MTDREQVIKGLESCLGICEKDTCPYWGCVDCLGKLQTDALALLKEQEAHSVCTKENCPMNANTISEECNVKTCPWRTEALIPKVSMSGLWYECPACGRHLTKDIDHYCAQCGRRVKWNGFNRKTLV